MVGLLSRIRRFHLRPCCPTCDGGVDISSPETDGRCWDCYGTGHTHPVRQRSLLTEYRMTWVLIWVSFALGFTSVVLSILALFR